MSPPFVVILCICAQLPEVIPKYNIISNNTTRKSALRIYGGRDVLAGEFPFIVRIENQYITIGFEANSTKTKHFCTGSVLSPTWTLTAAHYAMAIQKTINTNFSKQIEIVKPMIRCGNPLLKPSENNNISLILKTAYPMQRIISEFDVGLLHTESIQIEKYAKINGIDYKSLFGSEVTLTGFGFAAGNHLNGYESLDKPLQIIDRVLLRHCDDIGLSNRCYLCAVSLCGTVQVTLGYDSGAPVIYSSGVVGILSGGIDNLNLKILGNKWRNIKKDITIVTSVSPYFDWIHSHVTDLVSKYGTVNYTQV